MSKRALLLHDANRIQDYIFASGRLKEIRGASALVDSLTCQGRENRATRLDGFLKGYQNYELVYAGGGNIVALFDEPSEAQRFEREYTRWFYESTGEATSTGVALETQADYMEAFRLANDELRRRKDRGLDRVPLPLGGLIRPCGSCVRQPATAQVLNPDGETQWLCAACVRKREFGNDDLPRIYQEVFKGDDWHQRFSLVPADFGEIGAVSQPPGFLGVVYCDGNSVGKLLTGLGKHPDAQARFRKFSEGLDRLTRESVVEVLQKHFPHPVEKGGRRYFPYQIILAGGDDLLIVVPGDKALPVAADFVERFGKNGLSEILGDTKNKVTTSAGVMIVKQGHPFRDAVRLAKDLLKTAKKRTRAEGGVGCLDAMILTAPGAETVANERERAYANRSQGVELTPQPVTVEEYRKLADVIALLGQERFPTGKVYAIYKSLFQGRVSALLAYYDNYGRAKPEQRQAYDTIERQFGLTEGPFRLAADGKTRTSPYVLIAEWYDFLRDTREEREA